jgi:ADP-heptose:LPS heptosyltransferase
LTLSSKIDKTNFMTVAKAAWIRVGALGDLLVGLASLVETRARFPTARITVIGPRLFCEILSPQQFPWIERIAAIERKAMAARVFEPVNGSWRQSTPGLVPIKQILSSCQAAVNTNIDSYRYGFAAMAAKVPTRIGTAPAPMAWVYTHTAPFFGKDPLVHERDAALLLLEFADSSPRRFTQTVARNRRALANYIDSSSLIKTWRAKGLPAGKPVDLNNARGLTKREPNRYLLINPTSSRREKAWPSERFRELALKARTELAGKGIDILILGAPNETDWLKETAGDDFSIVQPPTIRDLQDVLSASAGLITNTSSVQFVAAMTGTPVVTLMGRAKPEIWGPLGPHDRIVLGHPPAELGHDIFAQELAGYRSIQVDEVLPYFISLIEQPHASRT